MRFIKKFIIMFLLSATVSSVNASGVKVNPSKIDLAAKINRPLSEEITITNPASDVQIFKVYPDDFSDIIKINPASFILEAGMKKDVTLTVEIKDDKKTLAVLNTNLSIVAKPLAEAGFQTNAGVKIPLFITISAENSQNSPRLRLVEAGRITSKVFQASAFIALLIIIGVLAYFLRRIL